MSELAATGRNLRLIASKRTLYNRYPGKDALIEAYLTHHPTVARAAAQVLLKAAGGEVRG